MPEIKPVSPLLDGFVIGEPISDHHGVCCCPAICEDTGERYIVKIISVPASQVQVDALFLTGAFATRDQALSYFEESAKGILEEAEILDRLTKLEGFVPYSGSQYSEMDVGTGYQVYLVSPYKRSLRKQMQRAPFTHLGAVNLGLDLCAALATSRRAGYLYIDLKPSNIFLTPSKGWRIGDLGFIPLSSLKYASFPEKYQCEYTAPEIKDAMSELNGTVDIYALGLVMYQIYNNGELPAEVADHTAPLPPPPYADYELAEIILKACDPNPAKRWSDPAQMGQALVSYMQRNTINDVPIIPPAVDYPEETDESSEKDFISEEENESELEEMMKDLLDEEEKAEEEPPTEEASPIPEEEELSFIDISLNDETVPSEENAAELEGVFLTQEVTQMLAQADELLSHELPEPVVAPDPIDIPFPAPIILDDENTCDDIEAIIPSELPQKNQEDSDEDETFFSEEGQNGDNADNSADISGEAPQTEPASADEPDDTEFSLPRDRSRKKKQGKLNIKVLCSIAAALVLLVAATLGASFLYKNYYLQSINGMTIQGDVSSFTIQIQSDIKDELLSVVCTDTYGNSRTSQVKHGTAQFHNLTPNTLYRIQVKISGTRKLTGNTFTTFTTPQQTEVINFNAVTGPEDGSAIISFGVNGPDAESWTMQYAAENETEQVVNFTGHTVTVSGLEIGKKYTFSLTAEKDCYLTGSTQLEHTAQTVIYAQNIRLTDCESGSIGIAWSAPEGITDCNWIVRCYSERGYDETIMTTDTQTRFQVPTHDCGYIIDVTAEGMTSKSTLSISENPITITEIGVPVINNDNLEFIWSYQGSSPANGWKLNYSVDYTTPITVDCASSTASLPYYPGSHYEITILPADAITCFSKPLAYNAPAAEAFDEYRVTSEDMNFEMCLTPEKEDWDRHDVKKDDYRNEFAVGEKASFVIKQNADRKKSTDEVRITYIIRQRDGGPISLDSETIVWNDMWNKRYCTLNVPRMPGVAGKYTIEIYFNGSLAGSKNFTIE